MKNRILGALVFIAGILIAIGPQTIFKVCGTDMMVMKCHYTAQAELAIGISTAVLGIVLFLVNSKEATVAAGIAVLLEGVTAILIPAKLIGVCENVHMHCNSVTRPALIILGAASIVLAVIAILLPNGTKGASAEQKEA